MYGTVTLILLQLLCVQAAATLGRLLASVAARCPLVAPPCWALLPLNAPHALSPSRPPPPSSSSVELRSSASPTTHPCRSLGGLLHSPLLPPWDLGSVSLPPWCWWLCAGTSDGKHVNSLWQVHERAAGAHVYTCVGAFVHDCQYALLRAHGGGSACVFVSF